MLISIKDFAVRQGVTYQAVWRAIKAGRLTLLDGKLDPAVADIQWQQNRRRAPNSVDSPNQPTPPTPALGAVPDPLAGVPTLESSRRRREFHEANLAEMRERQKAGELVELREVHLAYTTLAAELRAALERIPDKIAPRLAGAEPADVHDLLTAELDQALTDMAAQAATLPERLADSAKAQA